MADGKVKAFVSFYSPEFRSLPKKDSDYIRQVVEPNNQTVPEGANASLTTLICPGNVSKHLRHDIESDREIMSAKIFKTTTPNTRDPTGNVSCSILLDHQ